MGLYDVARAIKGKYKVYAKERAGKYLSPIRRIERVAPPSSGLYCAMTFDDGPTVMETNPKRSERGLTDDLLDTLAKYGAKGSFDVIGTTAENYPDEKGPTGTFTWGGITYDHYPDFEKDTLAGVVNQPELTRRILDEGHEITSHTYRHILFGQNRLIYGKRKFYQSIDEVIDDLKMLDSLLKNDYSYDIKMSRPPHYIDKTCDKHNAYDAYRYMNYQYMAASFDGGGWQISGDYQKDVQSMITPMEKALAADPSFLNGQIIFQKDGCNMSRETPVADALEPQLELLKEKGYKVITVSELLEMSPFEDIGDKDPIFESAKALVQAGYTVAHKNNHLYPDRIVTFGELLMMSANPQALLEAYRAYADAGFTPTDEEIELSRKWRIKTNHPYFHAYVVAQNAGLLKAYEDRGLQVNSPISNEVFQILLRSLNSSLSAPAETEFSKREVLPILSKALNL